MSQLADNWAAGSTYEHFMGRWSRQLAHEYVHWLDCDAGLRWLDLGCGTGALTSAICQDAQPDAVVACDPSAPFIEFARQHVHDQRASFVLAGASNFPIQTGGYDVAASLLALNFFPDPAAAVKRMTSTAAPGGTITACVWDYSSGMQFLRYFWDAAIDVEPRAVELDEGRRFPICNPDNLMILFAASALVDVRCEPLEIVTVFSNMEDYWAPLLGGTGPAPAFLNSLSPDKRQQLHARLEAALPRTANGEFRLRARAWAVRGRTRN